MCIRDRTADCSALTVGLVTLIAEPFINVTSVTVNAEQSAVNRRLEVCPGYLCSGAGPAGTGGTLPAGVAGVGGGGSGNAAVPSSANTYMIGALSTFALLGPVAVAARPNPPPNATYCLPSTS